MAKAGARTAPTSYLAFVNPTHSETDPWPETARSSAFYILVGLMDFIRHKWMPNG